MIEFIKNAHPLVELDQEFVQDLEDKSISHDVFQHHRFLQPGQIQESIYFITEGVVRSYYFKQGSQFTNGFFSAGDMMVPSADFFLRTQSPVYLEATCESRVVEIKKKEFFQLYEKYSTFRQISNLCFTTLTNRREEHIYNLSALDAFDRYQTFAKSFGYINARVQVKQLAVFLGMAPDTLSKMRNPSLD